MYQLKDISAQVYEAGASPRAIKVHVLDLHENGGRFVLRGYLHPGTRVDITLPTLAIGENIETTGVVGGCTHHQGMEHVVTVQFNESIDLAAVTAVIASSKDDDAQKNQTRELRVLLIDPMDLDCSMLAHRLASFSIHVTAVCHLGAGVDQVKMHHFDAVLMDDGVEDVSAPEEAVGLLREAGFRGPIIISTDRVSLKQITHLREHGVDAVLIRPTPIQVIGRTIRSACNGEASSGLPQLFEPALFDSANERDLLAELSRLRELVRGRRVAPPLLASLRTMSIVGSTMGLTVLGRMCEQTLRGIQEQEQMDEDLADELQDLIRETAEAIRQAA